MKIVIAGATGLIGQNLTRRLLEARQDVMVLTRNPTGGQTSQHPSLRFTLWDGKTAGTWTRQIDGADAVINLSGQSLGSGRWSEARKQQLLASRIDSTNAIVGAIKIAKIRPPSLLNASAVGFYGHVAEGDVAEDCPAGSDFVGRLCVQWETAALAASELGVRVVLLRSSIVLDTQGGALQRMMWPYRFFVGGSLGSGKQWLPWIHKVDEIRAILFALEQNTLSGPVNLAAPEATMMRDFCTALGKALHRPSALMVPGFVLRAILGEMADMVLTGQRVVPRKLTQAGFTFEFPTLQKALQDLLRQA